MFRWLLFLYINITLRNKRRLCKQKRAEPRRGAGKRILPRARCLRVELILLRGTKDVCAEPKTVAANSNNPEP